MILYNVGWPPPIVMLGGCSDSSDFDFLVIASSWIQPLNFFYFIFIFLVPNRCLHWSLIAILSLPQSLTCSLMNLPHAELWPRKIKRPFHQNIRDGKACSHSELVFHFCPTWPGGSAWGFWEDIWTLATVKIVLIAVTLPCLHSCAALPLKLLLTGGLVGSYGSYTF